MKSALLLLLPVPVLLVLLVGCDTANHDGTGQGSAGGTPVGAVFAEADFKPSGGSGTGGTALFKGVGSLGVQVDLSVSGLPPGDPEATYYAQVHEGSCPDERSDENGAGAGPGLAMVRFGGLVAKAQEYAHGGEEHDLPEEPHGSIEQPVSLSSSADGSASVSSLLEGVQKKRLMSGGPKYVDLHSAESEEAPVLACGVLKERR